MYDSRVVGFARHRKKSPTIVLNLSCMIGVNNARSFSSRVERFRFGAIEGKLGR
jgi:hypothetical protein